MNYGNLRGWLVVVICGAALCAACNQQAENPQAKSRRHHRFSEPKDDSAKEETAKAEPTEEDAPKDEARDTDIAKSDASKTDISKNDVAASDDSKNEAAKSDAAKDDNAKLAASDELAAKQEQERNPEPEERKASIEPSAGGGAPPLFADQLDPAELIVPKVLLTHALAETCLLKVGEPMPDLKLPDLEGKEQSLSELLGSKLTVVLFWRAGHPYDLEELADLAADVAAPYSERGVKVLAINEDESREEVRAVVNRLGVTFPVLLDPDGKALAEVAVGKLPRTYLLDPSGKVIWFDLHYSRSTRRDLLRAVRFTLSDH